MFFYISFILILKFAIAGKTEFQEGSKGKGYGLVTVHRPGKPLNHVEFREQVEKLYKFATFKRFLFFL